uniref:Uncharacterized protein n=1 Tax=Anopheles minimus TaxID=112268 RepID=A0A182WPE4_9DIPT
MNRYSRNASPSRDPHHQKTQLARGYPCPQLKSSEMEDGVNVSARKFRISIWQTKVAVCRERFSGLLPRVNTAKRLWRRINNHLFPTCVEGRLLTVSSQHRSYVHLS